jgi:hypothetical protein
MPHSPEYESMEGSANDFEAWRFTGARTEARALFELLGRNGNTKESLLELIRVSPRESPTRQPPAPFTFAEQSS